MELQARSSKLITSSTVYEHKAWHFVSILLSIGQPVRATELARNCTLFDSSPELVEFLCWIPNSPLTLTNDGSVTLSFVTFAAFGRFVGLPLPSRFNFAAFATREWREDAWSLNGEKKLTTYSRKRKSPGDELVPIAKRRATLQLIEDRDGDNHVVRPRTRAWTNAFKAHDGPSVSASVLGALYSFPLAESTFKWACFKEDEFKKPLAISYSKYHHSHIGNEDGRMTDLISTDADVRDSQHECTNAETIFSNKHLDDCIVLALPCATVVERLKMKIGTDISSQNAQTCPGKDELERQGVSAIIPSHVSDTEDSGKVRAVEEPPIDNDASKADGQHPSSLHDIACRDTDVSKNRVTTEIQANDSPVHNLDRLLPCDTPAVRPVNRSAKKDKQKQDVPTKPLQALPKPLEQNRTAISSKLKKLEGLNIKSVRQPKKQQIKNNPENVETCAGDSSKDHSNTKAFPQFDGFIVEEEEGSGGYGTVYRARRRSDAEIYAIKYPHPNAHKHHIENEKKMLERFGGRNYIIKYVEEFKSGNLDCFVLEHVVHDRPDVLKREIDPYQLQWYGYCLFKALASLHKEGVVHRDVKPGNFLFSRKTSQGYLIDFNLARDLHYKQASTDKSSSSSVTTEHNHVSHRKATSPDKQKKIISRSSKPLPGETSSKGVKPSYIDAKMFKMKASVLSGVPRNSVLSQGADGSVVTSTKDLTSNRTSGERLREPLPCQGRKELINFYAQGAMQNPGHATPRAPASKRKRVAAPPNGIIVSRKLAYHTPMPLHSSGIAIPGAGILKKKGDGKVQKEGPCAGTKGFRAPEVLIRSAHQGPKIDVWSAGVTLLYLIIGKVPFTGDPEQNMKDVVKLRGSEEFWEVAKLHNRESSFSTDLLDARFLQRVELTEWCMANTKRPEFLEAIPKSLLDLVDKCLTVNPRLRISAEEALRHEFFAPCHSALKKSRMLRQKSALEQEVRSSHPRHPSDSF